MFLILSVGVLSVNLYGLSFKIKVSMQQCLKEIEFKKLSDGFENQHILGKKNISYLVWHKVYIGFHDE